MPHVGVSCSPISLQWLQSVKSSEKAKKKILLFHPKETISMQVHVAFFFSSFAKLAFIITIVMPAYRWTSSCFKIYLCPPPPPLVQALPMYTIKAIPKPTVAGAKAWLARNTFSYPHTCAHVTCAEIGTSRPMGCIKLKPKFLVHQQRATEIGNCDDKHIYVATLHFVRN